MDAAKQFEELEHWFAICAVGHQQDPRNSESQAGGVGPLAADAASVTGVAAVSVDSESQAGGAGPLAATISKLAIQSSSIVPT